MKRIIPAIAAISVAATGLAWAQTAPPGTASGGGTGTTPGTSLTAPAAPGAGVTVPPLLPAQPATPAQSGTAGAGAPPSTSAAPAAVTTTGAPSRTTEAPVPGANSFTEGQARSRIEERGFAQVTELRKDDQGIWRAKAMKDGRSVNVSLDYQGNIVDQ